MQRTHIQKAKIKVGETVKLAGFVQTIRDQGGIKFLILRDITGTMQAVITEESSKLIQKIDRLGTESVIEVIGTIKKEKQAPGGVELKIEKLKVLSHADPELPIPVVEKVGETSQEKRLNWRWLDLRKPKNLLIFQVWTELEEGFREYWTSNGYMEIHSPKFMSTASESGSELFEVKYFDGVAYLAQSPQFYKQMAMASGFERVFEVGPVFRANPSFTSRHDTEFTGYDMEISYIDSHQDVIREEAQLIAYALQKVKKAYGNEIDKKHGRELIVPKLPFPQLTMKEAKTILAERGIESKKEGDLSPEEEREISKHILETQRHEFVYITEYPIEARPFYHMRFTDRPELTKSFDLLWNGLEITTGAQREHRYKTLLEQAKEKNADLEALKHYLNFFKYGCPPHGGLGLSPTRMLMKTFNVPNVREVTYLYRGVNRLTP